MLFVTINGHNLESDDLIYAVSPTIMPLKYELENVYPRNTD